MLVNIQSWGETLRLLVELAGTAAFAVSGVLEAARKKLDAVGVCVVAFLTAFGGGTLRDLLLDQRPFFWVRHTEFVWGILGLSVAAMLFMRQRHFQPTERAMLLPDAIGLGLFAAVGVDIATAVGMPALIAVMMGVTTGVFGGVLRDVLCNQVPVVFQRELYAMVSLVVCCLFLGLRALEVNESLNTALSFAVGLLLRMLAIWRCWRLPTFSYQQRWD